MIMIIIMPVKNYVEDTTISKHHLPTTTKKNYFVDKMTSERLCFETYHLHHLCC